MLRTTSLFALATAGLLFAMACGDDDDDNNTAATGGSTSTGGAGGGDTGDTGGTGGGTATGGAGGGTATGGAGGGTATGGAGGEGGSGEEPELTDCPTHPSVTKATQGSDILCKVSAPITSPVTQDLVMGYGSKVKWVLDGPVFIGDDTNQTVLTVKPGVTVYGAAGSVLVVQRSAKLMADGTKDKPIVFTSSKAEGQRAPEDWGGLVINGRAPINHGTGGVADGEAGTGKYGGTNAADNSGVLRYVRVEFTGNKIDQLNELNGIAFQGVGNGTLIDYIMVKMTSDDGIEMFGGTVDIKHAIVLGADDDSIDWMGGWTGRVQHALAVQLAESGTEADRGIEADNLEGNFTATPYSSPILSNLTLVGRTAATTKQGVEFRRGTKGQLWNSVVMNFNGPCVRVTDPATVDNVGDGSLVIKNTVLDCSAALGTDAATLVNAAGANNKLEAPLLGGTGDNTWLPQTGSPALGIGATTTNAWFDQVNYAGAFGTEDWAAGWTDWSLE